MRHGSRITIEATTNIHLHSQVSLRSFQFARHSVACHLFAAAKQNTHILHRRRRSTSTMGCNASTSSTGALLKAEDSVAMILSRDKSGRVVSCYQPRTPHPLLLKSQTPTTPVTKNLESRYTDESKEDDDESEMASMEMSSCAPTTSPDPLSTSLSPLDSRRKSQYPIEPVSKHYQGKARGDFTARNVLHVELRLLEQ